MFHGRFASHSNTAPSHNSAIAPWCYKARRPQGLKATAPQRHSAIRIEQEISNCSTDAIRYLDRKGKRACSRGGGMIYV